MNCSRYHPDTPTYDLNLLDAGVRQSIVGTYPCCTQKNLRFDPTQPNTVRTILVGMHG